MGGKVKAGLTIFEAGSIVHVSSIFALCSPTPIIEHGAFLFYGSRAQNKRFSPSTQGTLLTKPQKLIAGPSVGLYEGIGGASFPAPPPDSASATLGKDWLAVYALAICPALSGYVSFVAVDHWAMVG